MSFANAVTGVPPTRFFYEASRRRVDVAGIWDSNGAQSARTGHLSGWTRALGPRFGLYGWASVPGGGHSCFGAWQVGVAIDPWGVLTEPSEFTALRAPSSEVYAGGTSTPMGVIDWAGTIQGSAHTNGLTVYRQAFPIDFISNQSFSTLIWRPESGGATKWRPQICGWYGGVGNNGKVNYPAEQSMPTRSASGFDRLSYSWNLMDLTNVVNPFPAAGSNRWKGRGFGYSLAPTEVAGSISDGTNTLGIIAMRGIDNQMYRGVSVSPLHYYGGQSTRTVAFDMCGLRSSGGTTDAALATLLRSLTYDQIDAGGNALPPMLMILLQHGGNDAGDVSDKVDSGSNVLLHALHSVLSDTGEYRSGVEVDKASSIADGYINNTLTVIRRLRYVWGTVLGWDLSNLFFVLGAYHPQNSGSASAQWSFVRTIMPAAAPTIFAEAPSQICFVDGYKLATFAEFGLEKGDTTVVASDHLPTWNSNASPYTATATVPYYRSPTSDVSHLNDQGYDFWGQCCAQALIDASGGWSSIVTSFSPSSQDVIHVPFFIPR